jgi:CBS domain containing-hemolysin-like protein
MINFLYILIALALVLMNAFFVAAEFGMVKLRHTRVTVIKRTYGFRGRVLANIHKHLDAYLSACQLGITLASLGLGWIGEPAFAHLLSPIFPYLNLTSPELIRFISFFFAFTFISFLHIVIGELMPKSLAIRQSEKVSVWTAAPLYGFYWLMYPAIWILNTCSNWLLRTTRLDKVHRGEHFYSTDELKLILSTSHLHGELTKDEAEILEHTIDFADLKVTEVMRPYEEMINLDIHAPIEETLKTIAENRYSRYPVVDTNNNEIIGIIHVKDLFAALYQGLPIKNLSPYLRPILKVSQRLGALDLLRKFREGTPHFALIYKSDLLLGFVTLDNLLHVLIGRIKDEFHLTADDWIVNPDGSLLIRGDCPLFSLERAIDAVLDLDEVRDEPPPATVTGYILNKLGRLPIEGERLSFKQFKAIILKMRGPRILKIKIIPKQKTKKNKNQ